MQKLSRRKLTGRISSSLGLIASVCCIATTVLIDVPGVFRNRGSTQPPARDRETLAELVNALVPRLEDLRAELKDEVSETDGPSHSESFAAIADEGFDGLISFVKSHEPSSSSRDIRLPASSTAGHGLLRILLYVVANLVGLLGVVGLLRYGRVLRPRTLDG